MNKSIDYKPLIENVSSEDYYKQFKNVYIHCNNELGYYVWSVVSEDYDYYWINSYNTKKKLLTYVINTAIKLPELLMINTY